VSACEYNAESPTPVSRRLRPLDEVPADKNSSTNVFSANNATSSDMSAPGAARMGHKDAALAFFTFLHVLGLLSRLAFLAFLAFLSVLALLALRDLHCVIAVFLVKFIRLAACQSLRSPHLSPSQKRGRRTRRWVKQLKTSADFMRHLSSLLKYILQMHKR